MAEVTLYILNIGSRPTRACELKLPSVVLIANSLLSGKCGRKCLLQSTYLGRVREKNYRAIISGSVFCYFRPMKTLIETFLLNCTFEVIKIIKRGENKFLSYSKEKLIVCREWIVIFGSHCFSLVGSCTKLIHCRYHLVAYIFGFFCYSTDSLEL